LALRLPGNDEEKLLFYCFLTMVSRIEKVDDEFMAELREMSEIGGTKKHRTLKERFYEVDKCKNLQKDIKTTNGQFCPSVIDHLPFCYNKKTTIDAIIKKTKENWPLKDV